jgi:hypothetical protein
MLRGGRFFFLEERRTQKNLTFQTMKGGKNCSMSREEVGGSLNKKGLYKPR